MKRVMSIGVVFAFCLTAVVLFTASGGKEKGAGGKEPGGMKAVEGFDWKQESGETLNILLNRHPWTDSTEGLFGEFEELTGIKLKYDILSEEEYMEKLLIDLSMKSGRYDVFMAGAVFEWQYSHGGWIKPLDAYLEDPTLTPPDFDFDDFFPGLVKSHRWDGKLGSSAGGGPLWAIPIQQEVHCLYYNKWLLDKLNIKVPETYEEFYKAARKATTVIDGVQYRGVSTLLSRSWATLDNGFWTPYATMGGVDFDKNFKSAIASPVSVKFTEDWTSLLRDAGPPGVLNYTWYDQYEAFGTGTYAFLIAPSVQAPLFYDPQKTKVAGKVGYALPPKGPDGSIKSHQWTWGIAMNAETKKERAAWLFMTWATSKDIMLRAALNGNMEPPRRSVWNDPQVMELTKKWGARPVVQELMEKYAMIRFTPSPIAPGAGDRWAQALQEVYLQEKSAQEALSEAANDINIMVEEQLE